MLRLKLLQLAVAALALLALAPAPHRTGLRPPRSAERQQVRRISEIRAAVAAALAARPKDAADLPAQLRILQELAAHSGMDVARRVAGRLGVQLDGERVLVSIRVAPEREAALVGRLGELGVQATRASGTRPLRALVPVADLERVAAVEGVERLEAPRILVPSTLSEGVAATRAETWMTFEPPAGLPLDRPARVAIVDVGFAGYATLLGSELPATVDVQAFCDFPPQSVEHCDSFTQAQPWEHGTAVAEIVHDMAPEAELLLLAIDPAIENIQAALQYAGAHGADIVSTSIGTVFDNRDGTSPLCSTAADLRRSGIVWATAAGNSGDPCEHESYLWRSSGLSAGSPYGQFLGFPRNADPILNEFTLPAGHVHLLELSWNAWDAAPTDDLDLFYVCDLGAGYQLIAQSLAGQCGAPGSVPFEGVAVFNDGATDLPCAYAIAEYQPGLCVRPSDRRFDVTSLMFDDQTGEFTCPLLEERTAAYSIAHPADCPDTWSVGAVCALDGSFESYSGQGPTLDGRAKPEICAPDAVSTGTYGAALGCPGGTGPEGFAGTSASTPHVAGALALLVQRLGASFTPEQCRSILERRASGAANPVPDNRCGHGALCLAEDGCD